MDFFTTSDGPIEIKIDGKPYTLERFLLAAMKEWSASIRRQTIDEATAHLDADQKARFITYFQPPAIDLMTMAERAVSAEGTEYVCRYAMKSAGVPAEVIDNLIAKSDPLLLRNLADQLTTASRSKSMLESGGEGSPLPQRPAGSDDSAGHSAKMTPTSDTPTQELAPTA